MRLQMVLPPGWETFHVDDLEGCQRRIARIASALPLDDGQGARLRRELRSDLFTQVEQARTNGATLLSISGPSSPFVSGSLMVMPLDDAGQESTDAWARGTGGAVEHFTTDLGRVTRVVHGRLERLDETELPSLAVDYLVQTTHGHDCLVACSSPLVAHAEAMTSLFDTIVENASWDDETVVGLA
ncbi:hypothetical protein [Nocardioides acrostichi]|uniref:Uncharacterized protein n=1 Tax=Nocardioides acrostichi TaxID=2784339 RepID=A0A930UYN3_9ACTN|nr:hypothetical protein [Nocardioides acrostichi]MBF4161470.1 hypothetical protein [Nocardioides acrostichi]